MDINETKIGDAMVLVPKGTLTASADCQALEHKLKAVLESQTRQVVVDASAVDQIGSGGIRVLLLAGRKLGQMGGRLVLCELSERVRLSFKISGFDGNFTIVPNQERALAKVQESLPTPAPDAAASSSRVKRDPATRHREQLRGLLVRTLQTGLAKVALPPSANADAVDRVQQLVASLLGAKQESQAPSPHP